MNFSKIFIATFCCALTACQTTTTEVASTNPNGPTAERLILSQFTSNDWDPDWIDDSTRNHKCDEARWFYTGMANVRSVTDLDAFWDGNNPEGLDMNQTNSRTYRSVRIALEGGSIPEELKQKARCIIDPPQG